MRDVFVLHGTTGPSAEPFGCTWIRLLLPLAHPSIADRVRLRHGPALPARGEAVDVVVVERHWQDDTAPEEAEALVANLRARAAVFLHAIDDDLLDAPESAFGSRARADRLRRVVRVFARAADGLLVSTGPLAERMRRLNPNVAVVPNALDERLFPEPVPDPPGTPATIGYMGTLTHLEDLMLVLRPLRQTLRRTGARLELVGVSADARLAAVLKGLPVRFLDPGAEASYPRFPAFLRRAARWHLAIAPLVDDPFTRCKSDIKLLDYAALGVPGVYSDVPAYHDGVRHGETGLLVPNDPGAWGDALERLASDAALRARIREEARAWVMRERTLAARAPDFVEAIRRLSGRGSGPAPDRGRSPG